MNIKLNQMIDKFINNEYEPDKFCYDFNEEYCKVDITQLEDKYIQIYDNINEACSLFDDSNTYDNRLLNREQFINKVKEYYKFK